MKKYFVSFTYKKEYKHNDKTDKMLTFEILEIDLSQLNGYDSYAGIVSAVLFKMGYNGVNVLQMNSL